MAASAGKEDGEETLAPGRRSDERECTFVEEIDMSTLPKESRQSDERVRPPLLLGAYRN